MKNVWLVVKHEIISTLGKKSFWFTTFLLPILMLGFSLFPSLFVQDAVDQAAVVGEVMADGERAKAGLGYVDRAGALAQLPPDVPASYLRAFPDAAAARAALEAGEIALYYVIPADFDASGTITAVMDEFAPITNEAQEDVLRYALNYNLTGDARLARLLLTPAEALTSHALAPQVKTASDSLLGFVLPFAVMFILFFVITMTGSYMLQSVTKEKENRTAEVLLLSLRPRDLMLGKVLGLGVVALGQMAIWLGGGLVVGGGALALLSAAGQIQLSLSFLAFAVAFFLLGYLMYASLLGAVGALAPTAREGGQFTFLIILPLMIPFYLNQAFTTDPNGVVATALSLFPLSAPTAMLARMSVLAVPAWQSLVSLAGVAVTAYLFVLLAARFFRADTLLSTASLNWGRIFKELGKGRSEVA